MQIQKDPSLIENLGSRGEKLLLTNLSNSEEILVKIKGVMGEALIITFKRIYILKWGFMTGNTFGGRCLTFDFKTITGIEMKKSLLTGSFEIISPATQNTQKSYWSGRGRDTISSDNIVSISRNKFDKFQMAANLGRELMSQSQNQSNLNQTDDISKLEKLAELKAKGIITEEEFHAKKRLILGI